MSGQNRPEYKGATDATRPSPEHGGARHRLGADPSRRSGRRKWTATTGVCLQKSATSNAIRQWRCQPGIVRCSLQTQLGLTRLVLLRNCKLSESAIVLDADALEVIGGRLLAGIVCGDHGEMPAIFRIVQRPAPCWDRDRDRSRVYRRIRKGGYIVVALVVGGEDVTLLDVNVLTGEVPGPGESRLGVVIAHIHHQGVTLPVATRIAVPEFDVGRQVGLAIQMNDAPPRSEQKHDVARILADLIAVPVEGLGNT